MRISTNILFIIFYFFWTLSFSQNTVEFEQLRGENVPTQSITYAVAQDSIGNVWIASEEGVLKHNSKYYKIYNSYLGLPNQLSNRIKQVFVDSNQQVWIGSENGVGLYNRDLDVFDYVKSNGDFNPSLVEVIIEDAENNIWVGGFNGLWKYETNKKQKEFIKAVSNHNIQALCEFNGNIIFGTQKGVFSYNYTRDILKEVLIDSEEKSISFITAIDNNLFVGTKTGELYQSDAYLKNTIRVPLDFELTNAITDLIKIANNSYIIGTDGYGIYQLDAEFKKTDHFTEDPNNSSSISSDGIYDIELNNEGIWWVATYGGGLNYFDSSKLPFNNIRHKINNENSLIANFTRAIEKDKNGNIWFGTKKGISIWNRNKESWIHIKDLIPEDSNTNAQTIVLALEPDDDFMWIGTYNGGLFKININTLDGVNFNSQVGSDFIEKIYAIHKDSKGNIWVGGIEKDLTVIAPNNTIKSYPIQQIKSISETKDGHILISGRQGVFKITHQDETFERIEILVPDKKDLAYSTINMLYETTDGKLLLATNGEGLIFYNPEKKSIRKLKMNSGMPSDIVQGIIAIDNNDLWASTTKGLVNIKIKEKDTIINVFDQKDGLASTEFNFGSFKKLNDSLLAFGGIDGVTFFNPNEIKNESYKPRLVFDNFKLSNEIIKPGQKPLSKHINRTKRIVLDHKNNSIEIQFTGIIHSLASKVKYSWMLENFDETWSSPTNTNFATYTNLSPGDYRFKVKAKNKYGTFGDERRLSIEVKPPWWATNKAYFMYALLLIALLYTIIHFTTVINNKKNADEQIDFFNNITHEIKTPLTILISSLDSVTENTDSGDDSKKRIKTTVKRINSLFEQMLNFQKVTSADFQNQDVSQLDVYAHIQQRINNFKPLTEERNIEIILNNNWSEDFYYDKDSFDKMMLNLISNAIKYSLENGTITINTQKTQSGDLKIEIIDKGIGIPKDQQKYILKRYFRARNVINSQRPGTGLGLMMVKKMLDKTGGSISFFSEENKGTTFTLLIRNLKREFSKSSAINQKTTAISAEELEDNTELTEFSDSKILIVEDNNELRGLLVNALGNYFQIHEAINGKEGREMASTIYPDIIITDLIMPEMDGMQMSKHLKEDINLNHIPIFMLTVLQNSEQKLKSIETGISEYIEKPVDMKYLLAKIINTLKWQQKLQKKYVHDSDSDNAELFRNKHDQEFLTNLENTIIENIENNSFSVHDLSKSFGMSRTSLYMKLKNLVDLSPQDFVIHTKLKRAKNLLIEGEFSIKEVAYQSGFSNPKYFSTSFKKFYKMTPSGFLESLKKD